MGIHTLKLNISKLYGDLWYIMTTWVHYCRFSWAVYIYRRWINGPEVAKWGWCTWLTRIVHQLWEWVGIRDCFFKFIIFMDSTWDTDAISEGFKRYEQFRISYEFWKLWSNYSWPEFVKGLFDSQDRKNVGIEKM